MVTLLIILLLSAGCHCIECGPGVPILTRIPNGQGSYTVTLQCLCPIDYLGMQCSHHRKLSCYLQTQQSSPEYIDSSNFEERKQFTVTFSTDCYIQLDNLNYISYVEYFLRKELQDNLFEYELESGRQGGQIVWANDSALLDEDGSVRYQEGYNYTEDENGTRRMSKQDEHKILNGKGKYQFEYKSEFLGFPFTDSQFSILPSIYKVLTNKRVLPQQTLEFTNYNEYSKAIRQRIRKQRQARQYIQNLSWTDVLNELSGFSVDKVVSQVEDARKELKQIYQMDVVPLVRCTIVANLRDQTEFKMLKSEFQIVQTYAQKFHHTVSVNSAVVRIPIDVEGVGEAKIYNNNFYKPPSRVLYFFIAALCLFLLYLGYKLYKMRKLGKMRQIKKQVEEEYEEKEFR